ncbi:copia protein [Tanacetum coccineum]|uniref:Copia protein n=1 Tax=Tanacetum coccineum TaxID=301880 RepID=A0ABQ5FYR4_9ASTR
MYCTCPKSFNERDNKAPSTPVTRKKQVMFSDKPGTSSSNTQKHKVHQRVQQTNIPVIPSTGVNDSTEASGSKPRSNTKKNRILPAKKENKKEVEVRLRTNKSYSHCFGIWTQLFKTYDGESFKAHGIIGGKKFYGSKVRFGNDSLRRHPWVYGDYVMGYCLPKANTCFVRDIKQGTDIIKGSAQSSSGNVNSAEPNQVNYPPDHLRRWTKDHPLDNIIGNPSRPVSTRKQLASDALWCCFHTELSKVKPKNFKMVVIEDSVSSLQMKFTNLIDLKVMYKTTNSVRCKGITSGEGIDFEESFAPVARIEANRIYIATAGKTKNISSTRWMSTLTFLNDAIMRDVKIPREGNFGSAQFLGYRLLAGIKEATKHRKSLQRLNTSPCLDVVLKSFGCDHSSKTTDLTSIKFLCIVITRVLLLFAVTTSSTLDQNTSTYGTISSESKWKIEWLNSTSWKRIINLQTFSPKHYQENDEQIVPRSQWLTIGKSNLLFNAQKIQKNPIFQISVDILSNTNFFQAFTASANVPAIYLQQFWNTMKYNEKTGVYSCQVDEQWFDLSADLLRKALAITPVIPAHPFELPPSGNTVIDFVNELGYPEPVEIVSNIRVNYVYQPWRAILSLINQCLTGKTSGSDKPRHPVLQMLWGIVTQTNVDHAELLWEEFTQGIQTFFSHKASHKASLKNPKKKVTPLLIPYGRFSKVIIYYLASNNNIHRRPDSAVHHTGDDYILGNLKFVPKGESVEVFGMAIPDPLITEAIQQSSYYPKYGNGSEIQRKPSIKTSVQPATKRCYTQKATTTTPVKQSKPAPPPTNKPSKRKLPQKVRKGKPTFQLVDEDDEAQQESISQEEDDDPDLEMAKKMSLEAHQEKGEGEGDDADMERAIKLSLDPAFLPQGRAPVGGVMIRDPVSETTSKLHEVVGKGKAVVTEEQVAHSLIDLFKRKELQNSLSMLGRDQNSHDSTTGPFLNLNDLHNRKVIHKSSSSLIQKELQVKQKSAPPNVTKIKTNVSSMINQKVHSWFYNLSMKNLDDTFNFGDQFLYDKPTEDDQEKSKVREESDSIQYLIQSIQRCNVNTPGDLIEKYSVLPGPESIQNQESEKSQKKIIRIKKEQDKVKDHKRKHDSDDDEDDDDDEGPSAGSNQGKSAKRRRHDSGASGSAQPPIKDDEQSSKKPRESDASASKQHPALTSTGWQITDTRDVVVDSSMPRSDTKSEHSKQSSDDIPMQDEGHVSDMEDTDNAHIPKVSTTTWFKPIPEGERPATPEPEWTIPPNDFPEPENNWANTYATTYKVPAENKLQRKTYDIGSFIKWFCRRTGKKKLCKADLEGPAFNLVKAFHKNSVFLQYQMDECHKLLTNKVDMSNPEGHQILRNIYEPLPLGGPPGQVTIQPQFFFNKDLDYLLTGDKERKIALSISKIKAARYLDFGLEELVPSLWVESERDYDISAVYGITHWWFRRKEFYINKHSEPSDREAVRSQMRILSVISVKVFEKYGYNYLREIILRRADYQEYKISEKDFKNLHPNDFEDLFLLNIQEKLNHLPKTDKTSLHTAVNMWIRNLVIRNRVGDLQLGIESYQTKINLERPNWDAADYYFKEDYTIVPKPRAVVYRDRNDQRKLMRLNELHKFSDGTLTRVMEKLDHMVKDFHLFEYNKGMETRKWSEDDKRRSKDFITAIEKRLQIRRIYRSLESFVGGRIRDIDYRLINKTT